MSVKVFEIPFRSRDVIDLELVFSWSNTVNTILKYQSLHEKSWHN